MKIIIFSDSHGYTNNMSDVLFRTNFDLIIHLGDYIRDAEKLQKEHPNSSICYIPGNNDIAFFRNSFDTSGEKLFEVEGKRILACHGHKYNVKNGIDRLVHIAGQRNLDIILFGHTHVACNIQKNGHLLLNPGSISQYGTYAVLNIDKSNTLAEIKYV